MKQLSNVVFFLVNTKFKMANKLIESLPRNIREEVVNCTSIEPLLSAKEGRQVFENYLITNQSKQIGDLETKIGDFIKYWELWKTASSILQTDEPIKKIRLSTQSLERDFNDAAGFVTTEELLNVQEAADREDLSEINRFFERCKVLAEKRLDENVFPSVARDLTRFCLRKRKKCTLV